MRTMQNFTIEKLTAFHEIVSRKIALGFTPKQSYVTYEQRLRLELMRRYEKPIPAIMTQLIKDPHKDNCQGFGKWIDRTCPKCTKTLDLSPKYPKRKNPFV